MIQNKAKYLRNILPILNWFDNMFQTGFFGVFIKASQVRVYAEIRESHGILSSSNIYKLCV